MRGEVPGVEAWRSGLRAGAVFGRYELVREVGRGGFGVVWEARDLELGRPVAFKALRLAGEGARERRLMAEAEVAARLSHPNIVTVLDVGRSEHGPFLVLEYLTGAPLSARLGAGPLPLREALRIATEIARGLAHAHAHGVVHRDLSPRNVQLCEDGQVKIVDLGMAQAFGRRKVEGGTRESMAPEQLDGAPEDERTDVYALGVLIFRMVAGVSPFGPGGARVASGIEVPEAPALARLIEATLERAPTARPRDAGEVLRELGEIAAALPPLTGDRPSLARIRAPARRRATFAAALGAAAALAVAGAAGGTWWWAAGAQRGGALVLAAAASGPACEWTPHEPFDFEAVVPGAIWRNGELQGQQLAYRDGRRAWLQDSDWNELFVPVGRLAAADLYAVEASFSLPPAASERAVALDLFVDPVGDGALFRYGVGLTLTQPVGRAPEFRWGGGLNASPPASVYSGVLPIPSIVGGWHTIRVEGSLARCWQRAILDGRPLLTARGACDLRGGFVLLGSNGQPYQSTGVAWRDLGLSTGTAACR